MPRRVWAVIVGITLPMSGCDGADVGRRNPPTAASSSAASSGLASAFNTDTTPSGVAGFIKHLEAEFTSKHRTLRSGPLGQDVWSFKSRRPVARNASGAFYHRFTLQRTGYADPRSAALALSKAAAACEATEQVDAKGRVSYLLAAGPMTYELKTDCLMNRALERHVKRLELRLLPGKAPEPGSVVRYACGGSCGRF